MLRVLRPRNRLVNFRLTEQEFEQLRSACLAQGGRCLSEFARMAVLEQAQGGARTGTPAPSRLRHLDRTLVEIDARLRHMLEKLDVLSQRILLDPPD